MILGMILRLKELGVFMNNFASRSGLTLLPSDLLLSSTLAHNPLSRFLI